jgi:effector-binding domain-containing protein
MMENNYLLHGILITTLLLTTACNDNQSEKKVTGESKKDSAITVEPAETKRAPVINIGDTISIKRMVLSMKDSAATIERVGLKLGEIYGAKLGSIIKKNNIKITGSPVAWFKGEKAPYFFEAGIPIDKKPSKLPAGVYIKQIGTDSVVVAHFYGPNDLLPQAYDALRGWLKDHKKRPKGAPYEIYVSDPLDLNGKLKDPYKVQTDIVWAWR